MVSFVFPPSLYVDTIVILFQYLTRIFNKLQEDMLHFKRAEL